MTNVAGCWNVRGMEIESSRLVGAPQEATREAAADAPGLASSEDYGPAAEQGDSISCHIELGHLAGDEHVLDRERARQEAIAELMSREFGWGSPAWSYTIFADHEPGSYRVIQGSGNMLLGIIAGDVFTVTSPRVLAARNERSTS